jgi:hypothetical protein
VKVYILSDPTVDMPGAVAWESICHDRSAKLIIMYEPLRWLSRHETADRKRPYCVRSVRRGRWSGALSYHATLAAAVKAAGRLSTELRS